MRFVRYGFDGSVQWGVETDAGLTPLDHLPIPEASLEQFSNPWYRSLVGSAVATRDSPPLSIDDVSLLAPVPEPGKIVCVGMNYRDHALEQDEPIPERPLLFGKAPTAVTHPGDPVVTPPGIEELDYEVELAIVIGRTAHRVDASDADSLIAGYTVHNDVSARDAQFDDEQWFRGKSFDTFAPMGPALVVGDGFDPNDVAVALAVNGERKQESSTAQFVFDVGELVEYVSHSMTLRPGDVISTGTPGGVGIFRDPPDLLKPGDTMTARIAGIGELTNPVVAPPDGY